MEHSFAFRKPKALAGFVDRMTWSHRKKCSKLLSVIWMSVMYKQAGKWKRRNNSTLLTNCCPIKANVKHFLQLCVQTFQFIRNNFSQRDILTFPSWAVQKGVGKCTALRCQAFLTFMAEKKEVCDLHLS